MARKAAETEELDLDALEADLEHLDELGLDNEDEDAEAVEVEEDLEEQPEPPTPKRRGRPPKQRVEEEEDSAPASPPAPARPEPKKESPVPGAVDVLRVALQNRRAKLQAQGVPGGPQALAAALEQLDWCEQVVTLLL